MPKRQTSGIFYGEAVGLALDFSEELPLDVTALRDVAHDFALQRLREAGLAADRSGSVPWDVLREAGELGLCAPNVPEEHGGPAVSVQAQAAMAEELGWGNLGIALSIVTQALCAAGVLAAGEKAQQDALLPGLCGAKGLSIGALALSEPERGAGEIALAGAAPATSARRAGTGYRIDGRKLFVANGGDADLTILLAATEDGDGLFALPKDAKGLSLVRRLETSGLRALQLAELELRDCAAEEGARLSARPGQAAARAVLQLARVLSAAALVGTVRAALEEAAAYARSRRTFGRPLIEHGQVAGQLAQVRLRIDAARLLVLRAAGDLDAGRDASVSTSEAAFLAGETAVFGCRTALQAFGGYGFTQEFPVEMWLRDAVGGRLAYGGADLHLLEVAQAIARGA